MDPNNGHIYQLTEAERKEFEQAMTANVKREGRRLIPLTEAQHRDVSPLPNGKRKNYMRNQPCVCGSGKKFKRCCWSSYA